NVGIGTTSPASKLSVAGDSYFHGDVYHDGNATTTGSYRIGGGLTLAGLLSVNGTGTSSIADNFEIGGTLKVGSGSTYISTNKINFTGASTLRTLAGGLTITSADAATWSTSAGLLTLSGAAGITETSTGGTYTVNAAGQIINITGAATTINSSSFALNNTGAITIGVNGSEQNITFETNNFDINSTGEVTIDGTDFIYTPTGNYTLNAGGSSFTTIGGSSTFTAGGAITERTGGAYNLFATSSIAMLSDSTLNFTGVGISLTASGGNILLTYPDGQTFRLTDGTTRIETLATGELVLGDSAATTTIEGLVVTVNGNTVTTGVITNNIPDNTASAFLTRQGANNYINIDTNDDAEQITFGNAATNPAFTFLGSGNVGIGTTSPNQKLSIYNNAADSAIEFSSASGANYKWTMGLDYTDGSFRIASSSALGTNDRFVINGNGNVGIGITNPGYKLEVAGTLGITSGNLTHSFSQEDEMTSSYLFLTNQKSGYGNILVIEPKDDDGTDFSGFWLRAKGVNGSTAGDREEVSFTWDRNLQRFILQTQSSGTGIVRDLEIKTGGNTNQLYLRADGNVSIGNDSTDTVTINSSFNSSLIPDQNATRDIGSPALYWDDFYIDQIVANNLSAASTTISGTQSSIFTLNTDNASGDEEDSYLTFYRGVVVPNAVITWDSLKDRFDFNQPVFIQNDSSTTTVATLDLKAKVGQSADIFRALSSDGDDLFNIAYSGNVGIGSSSPAAKFSVVGNSYLNGEAYHSGNATTTGSYYIGENLNLGGFLSVSGGFSLDGDLDMNDGLILNIGNVGTDFDAGGGLTLAGLLSVNGTGTSTIAENLDINGALAVGSGLYVDSTGIIKTGTWNASSIADAYLDNNLTIAAGTISGASNTMSLGSDATGDIYYRDASGYLTRLPIGTSSQVLHGGTTPSYGAIVAGNITADSLDFSEFKNLMTLDASTDVALAGNNFTFSGAGNIGIGTTSPLMKLSIQGSAGQNIFSVASSTGASLLTVNSDGQCVTGDTLLPVVVSANQKATFEESEIVNIKYVQIKDIKSGMEVLSLNEKTGELEPAKIKGLLDMGVKPIYEIETESGKKIRTTGNHPYLARFAWTKVSELSVGDEIAVADYSLTGASFEKIKAIKQLPAEQVYDIEVEGTHNFVANGIIAHNTYIYGTLNMNANPIENIGNAGTDFNTDGGLTLAGLLNANGNATTTQLTSTGSAYLATTGGNVGIGTASPGYPLDVESASFPGGIISLFKTPGNSDTALQVQNSVAAWQFSVRESGDTNPGGFNFYYSPDGSAGWVNAMNLTTGGNVSIPTGALTVSGAGNSSFVGNVGIGDATPAALLTVGNGDLFQVNSSGAIAAAKGITNTGAIGSTGGIINLNVSSNFATNINTGTSAGAVSIGGNLNTVAIDSSDWNIDAAGAITNATYEGLTITSTTGILTIGALKTLTLNDSTTFNTASLTLGNAKTLTLSDSTTLATNSITFAGTESLTLAATKSVNFADAFTTSGAFPMTLTTTAGTNVTLPTTGTLSTLAGAETFTNKVSYNGLVITANTGDITTGTWNGTSIADGKIDNNLTIAAGTISGASNTMSLGSDATGDIYYRDASGYLTRLAIGTATQVLHGGTIPGYGAIAAGDITADSLDFTEFKDLMTLDASTDVALAGNNFTFSGTGNVGIGIINPAAKLNVVDTIVQEWSKPLLVYNPNIIAGQHVQIGFGVANSSYNQAEFNFNYIGGAGSTSNTFSLGLHSAADILTLHGTGNVGIGTTSPLMKLSVQGTAGADIFNVASSTGANLLTVKNDGNTYIYGTLNMNNNPIENIGNAGTDFDSSGGLTLAGLLNVNGTGTSTIAENLDIAGALAIGSGMYIDNTGTVKTGVWNGTSLTDAYLDNNLTIAGGTISGTSNTMSLGSDAQGDTYYRDSSGYLARLALGAGGYVLSSSGGNPAWVATSTIGIQGRGNGAANQIAYWSDANTITSNSNFLFNGTTNLLTVTGNASTTQLTTTGSTYLATTGGNVGIGTTTPEGILDLVSGASRFLADLSSSGLAKITTPDTTLRYIRENAFDYVYWWNGTAFTDRTAEAKSTRGTSFTVVNDTADFLYIGKSGTYSQVYIDIATAAVGAGTIEFEYSLGGGNWGALSVTDGTSGLTVDGTINFTPPVDWATDTVNGSSGYWVRISETSSSTTDPSVYLVIPWDGTKNVLEIFGNAGDTTGMVIDENGQLSIANANTIGTTGAITTTSSFSVSRASLTTTSVDGVALSSSSSATAAAPVRISPRLRFAAEGWDTTALVTKNANFIQEVLPVSGDPVTASLNWSYDLEGGGYSELMRLTSTGNLGIGTTSPLMKLSVQGTAGADIFNVASSTGANLLTVKNDGNTYIYGSVQMNNNPIENIGNAGTDFDSSGGLTLAGLLNVNGTGTSTIAENLDIAGALAIGSGMYIDNTGTVKTGVWNGTSLTDAYLDNNLTIAGGTISGTSNTMSLGSDAQGDTYYRDSSGYLARLALGAGGYVLSSSGGNPAWVATSTIGIQGRGNGAANQIAYWSDANTITSNSNFLFNGTTNLLTVTGNASTTQLTTTGSTYLATGGGNVGIGTAEPGAKLDVNGELMLPIGQALAYADASRVRLGGVVTLYTDNNLYLDNPISGTTNTIFRFNGLEKVRIQSSGNVGIGTTSPGVRLDINGKVRLTPEGDALGHDYNEGIRINDAGNDYATITMGGTGTVGTGVGVWSLVKTPGDDFNIMENGGTHLAILDNGNVGIGTTSPSSFKLQVLGHIGPDADSTYDLGSSAMRFSNAFVRLLDAGANSLNHESDMDHRFTIGGAEKVRIQSDGNVGIGTTSPGAKLHLVGAAYSSSRFLIQNQTYSSVADGTGGILFQQDNDGMLNVDLFGQNNIFSANATKFIIDGNVGIGTTSPLHQLHVGTMETSIGTVGFQSDGNHRALTLEENAGGESWQLGVNASGDLLFEDSGLGSASVTFQDGGNVGIGTTDPGVYKLYVSGNTYINGTVTGTVISGTNGTFSGNLKGNRISSTGGVIDFDDMSGSNFFQLTGGVTTLYNSGVAGFSQTSGNVGIGTTGPGAKLEVNRATQAAASATGATTFANSALALSALSDTSTRLMAGVGDGSVYTWIQSQNISTDAARALALNPIGGNVGIGTTSPGSKLQVLVDESDGSGVANGIAVTGDTNSKQVILGVNSTYGWIQSHGSAPLYINPVGSNVILNPTTGNVGIGTTGPGDKLSIQGGALSFQNPSNPVPYVGLDWDSTSDSLRFRSNNNSSALNQTNVTIQRVSGNVGIGTTSPLGKLHLSGNTLIDSWMSDTGAALDTKNWAWQVGSAVGTGVMRLRALNDANTNGVNAIEFTRTGISSIVTSIMSGNVGIGTTDPGYALDVNGAIRTSNVVYLPDAGIIQVGTAWGAGSLTLRNGATTFASLSVSGNSFTSNLQNFYMGSSSGTNNIGTNGAYDLALITNSTPKVTIQSGGNVGIGTTSPARKLEISTGVANIATLLTDRGIYFRRSSDGAFGNQGLILDPATSELQMQSSGGGGFLTFYDGVGTEAMRITNGNVGIGTTEPGSYKLNVNGTANFSGDIMLNNEDVSWSRNQYDFATSAVRTNISPFSIKIWDNYEGASAPTTYGTLLDVYGYSGHEHSQLYFGHDGSIMYRDAFYNESSFSSWSTIWQSSNDGSGSTLDADLLDGQHGSYYLAAGNISGTDNYIPRFNGTNALENSVMYDNGTNVGIGTTDPGAKLQVIGDIYSDGATNSTLRVGRLSSSYYAQSAYASAGTVKWQTGLRANLTGYNIFDEVAGVTRLYVDDTGGNVGIGTTSPSARLHIEGGYLRIGDATASRWLEFSEAGTLRGYLGYGDSGSIFTGASVDSLSLRAEGDLHLGGTGNNLTMTINNGNVGIGTTSPGAKLDVIDDSQVAGLRIRHSNLTTGLGIGYGGILATGTNADIDISLASKGSGGYVWLGKNTVGTGIRVSSGDSGNNHIWAGNSNLGLTANTGYKIFLSQTSNSSTGLTVDTTNGNVGIGTTGPTYKLVVSGNSDTANITGGIFQVLGSATNALLIGSSNASPYG
ncbi:MAG: hypothetical protein WC734_06320, partial [Patescibacteria group bacterium]